ncbi:hypothetical protein TEU_03370 [Thermococcus eurythermalis]|uniref:Uncharacterized protein n=2 Tax=Thermococcus eurythermalis TaxID=1505907 RepID=A0A097QSM1_9EURY|nr:hypothetical protein TEU_03370 [Thermococcus eurythermalis]
MKIEENFHKKLYNQMINEFEKNGLSYTDFLSLGARKQYFLSRFWFIGARLSFLTGFVNTFFLLIMIVLIQFTTLEPQSKIVIALGVLVIVFTLNTIMRDYQSVFEAYFSDIIHKEVVE